MTTPRLHKLYVDCLRCQSVLQRRLRKIQKVEADFIFNPINCKLYIKTKSRSQLIFTIQSLHVISNSDRKYIKLGYLSETLKVQEMVKIMSLALYCTRFLVVLRDCAAMPRIFTTAMKRH